MRIKTAAERFTTKIRVIPCGGCWEWEADKIWNGYGRFWNGTYLPSGSPKKVLAHRWSYEHFIGPIPEGLHIDHLCRNRLCVNPTHLEPVTNQENAKRGNTGKGRRKIKESNKRGML